VHQARLEKFTEEQTKAAAKAARIEAAKAAAKQAFGDLSALDVNQEEGES
jgi:anti-sigma factor RsiW